MEDYFDSVPLCSEIIAPSSDKTKGGLYLGRLDVAETAKHREAAKIGAILSVIHYPLKLDFKGEHLALGVTNRSNQDISQFFEQSNEFIRKNLVNTNVFVHCQFGISRSPTIVLAYLIACNPEITVEEQIKQITAKRHVVDPNEGFIVQLRAYRDKLLASKK